MSAQVLFMLSVVIPLFFASPASGPLWLSAQAAALAWNVTAQHGIHSVHEALAVFEVLLVRGVIAPWFLRRASSSHARSVDHLLPSNLFTWMLGISGAVVAFDYAAQVAPAAGGLVVGSVCATIVLALLLLATNEAPSAQLFALLLMENAAVLFESDVGEAWSLWVHATLTGVYVLTVWAGVRLVQEREADATADAPGTVQ